jgi:hypothetical protein
VPTKRRKRVPERIGISADAIVAWQEGDFHGLARALELRPWQIPPWPLRMGGLGVDPDRPPPQPWDAWASSWPKAVELQRVLIEAAGEPPARFKDKEPVRLDGLRYLQKA